MKMFIVKSAGFFAAVFIVLYVVAYFVCFGSKRALATAAPYARDFVL